jgi:hypothetical protein
MGIAQHAAQQEDRTASGFIKKTQATPQDALLLAKRRMAEVKQ